MSSLHFRGWSCMWFSHDQTSTDVTAACALLRVLWVQFIHYSRIQKINPLNAGPTYIHIELNCLGHEKKSDRKESIKVGHNTSTPFEE